ncbi:histone deacetylation protein Rxt3-domain-containing protein [Biscogniauxia mediterranea]|nr:histone deacetylation protein Rxt3-domain-containing protein [Biscogniauxia mediterranea]
MDSRQPPQLPFARNAGSPPYGRSSFPPGSTNSTASSSPYPPPHPAHPAHAAHAASTSPAAAAAFEHQRRTSDANPFSYPPQSRPPYAPEPTSHPAQTHSRHQSASSIGNAPIHRAMPPPSPPQHQTQQPPPPHQLGPYGVPPSRAPPVNLNHPSSFASSGRELPALNSIPRTGSTGMSISSMLGGPPPAPREPTPAHAASYPPPITSSAASGPGPGPGPAYAGGSVHASPRTQSANEYSPYSRRPQTPEQGRPFDGRDPRGSAAGSPPQGMYGTPELSRYGTPQAYPARGPPMAPADDGRRDPSGRIPPASVPPRPSSQPRSYHGMAPRSVDLGRGPPPSDSALYGRRDEGRPAPVEYNPERQPPPPRAVPFEDQRRFMSDREIREQMNREAEFRERERRERERIHFEEQRPYIERERFEREREMEREREREREMERERERERELEMRERARRERTTSDPNRPPGQHPGEFGPGSGPQAAARHPASYGRPDPRDPAGWQQRPSYDQQPPREVYPHPYPAQRPNEFPVTTAPPYGAHPAYAQPPPERFPTTGPPHHAIPTTQAGPPTSHPFESPEKHRFVQAHPQPQPGPPHRGRPIEEGPPPPSVAYSGGPGPAMMDHGRPRPLEEGPPHVGQPRGLLGVQEINRKGRVSPLPQAVQGAQPLLQGPAGEPGIKSEFGRMFSGIGSGVRGIGVSSPVPSGAQIPFTNASLARRDDVEPSGHEPAADVPTKTTQRKRRKPKDDDGKGDDDSTGRVTPLGRAKRTKTHAHHHHHQSNATLAVKPAPTGPVIIPKPKQTIKSRAVLDSVADKPRKHLGDVVYQVTLKPAKLEMSHSRFGYSSTPRPLPIDVIKGNENSTLTVKVPRVHLTPSAREEITARRAVWGTDVYTDDSDVIAACIHAGWIRGEWGEDVDPDLLDLHKPVAASSKAKQQRSAQAEQALEVLTSVPASGPVHVPADRDLHVTLLILPALEKYSSSTRYGIQSREFGGTYNGRKSVHDGISFMIQSVRWVDGAAPQSRLRGKARRERIRKAMSEVNRSQVVDIGEREVLSKMVGKVKRDPVGSGGDGNKENRPVVGKGVRPGAPTADESSKGGNDDDEAAAVKSVVSEESNNNNNSEKMDGVVQSAVDESDKHKHGGAGDATGPPPPM